MNVKFPSYLSIKEVAAVLKISIKTVYSMANKGQIPGHFKLGSIHYIDSEELFKNLKRLATNPEKKVSKFHYDGNPDRHGLLKSLKR